AIVDLCQLINYKDIEGFYNAQCAMHNAQFEMQNTEILKTVFKNGNIIREQSLKEIRDRLNYNNF
ncbi:MAG: hypothetical protein II193_12235, partial [Lachnospiraceae bacterium]|nr:hypothetical protein [Lachnospiraceae bacterium]